VPIKKSVFPNYIICLEDGKKLKMLKRHLKVSYHLEPDEYRAKWGLPASYPMVAPNYAEQRSSVAKKIGFGHRPAARFVATEPTVHKIPVILAVTRYDLAPVVREMMRLRLKNRFGAICGAYGPHDVPEMNFNRGLAHIELVRDKLVRLPLP
jgi:hypothetical protein